MNQSLSINDYDIDVYFDSPQPPQIPFFHLDQDESPLFAFSALNAPKQKKGGKVQREKIRTNRNSQKIYHNILKHWLIDNNLSLIANKYQKYFNQRIYFVLVLSQIAKHIDNLAFLESYRAMTAQVKKKKENEIKVISEQKEKCEYLSHLGRIIEEIDYSLAACQAFIGGDVMDSIIIVFKRNQKKITKMKEFRQALRIFEEETGAQASNI